ncbi:glycosyltransferase family 4 protein [Dyella sp.]|jgi:glycosyltransferase involved in cell wall biosynthesis|uniref:glycosyltransferase family 4 protein n=1 Tax=Dyella sp. TaxID=1869338 RepID=UPI002D79EA42|nr:glycosyltransferase family 4 protein [Dyella sp.]HET6431612.1 glycosyltransferase family 4 protein [Dyella sp.]
MKFILFANTDWYLYNFRLSTALRLQADGHEVVMLSPPGPFGSRFAGHGLRWVTLPMDRASLNPLREAVTWWRLVRVLRRERPDLLHSFTVKCAVYGALAARVAGVPAVVNAVAGMGYVFTSDGVKARVLRPLVKLLLRTTLRGRRSLLILQNPDDAEAFSQARLVDPGRVRMIRSSGVDTRRFAPADRLPVDGEPLRVLLAARLLWEKGIQEFVDAAKQLHAVGRNVEFLLAGTPDPGNPRSVSPAEVKRWDEEGIVTWLGHVDDMPALLRTVHVMALPSYYREGVPKSLIEAAACGLAIVTTDLPGCREVVTEDGRDGLRVAPRDAAALAQCIIALDDDRALLERLGRRARQRALDEFDERSVIQRTIDVYNELLPRAGRQGQRTPAAGKYPPRPQPR